MDSTEEFLAAKLWSLEKLLVVAVENEKSERKGNCAEGIEYWAWVVKDTKEEISRVRRRWLIAYQEERGLK